jgi:hypothetical protein
MSERRLSSSSMVPTLRSMDLQYHSTIDSPPLIVTVGGIASGEVDESLVTRSVVMKSTIEVNPMLAQKTRSNQPSLKARSVTEAHVSSVLDTDSDNDEPSTSSKDASIATATTIDMIQTLPFLDTTAVLNNNNNRRYFYILPTYNSTCSLQNVSSLSSVLHCISNFLRMQSIPCTLRYSPSTVAFHCARNSAFASLGGPSLVFIIHLWYEQPKKDDVLNTDKSILIDVQRRQGCLLDLQCIRRALFRTLLDGQSASKGSTNNGNVVSTTTAAPVGKRQGMIPLDICRSIWATYYCKSDDGNHTEVGTEYSIEDESIKASAAISSEDMEQLSHYQEMLSSSNSSENHRMGLECLSQQTDTSVTDVSRSRAVVNAIVWGGNSESASDEQIDIIDHLRNSLLRFLVAENGESAANRSICVRTATGCSKVNLYALTLKVLANALNADVDSLKDLSIENDPFWRTVVYQSRRNIVSASNAPCIAAMSMHLITVLLSSSESVPSKTMMKEILLNPEKRSDQGTITSSELWSDISTALSWGQLHHSKLEEMSQKLMDVILAEFNDKP